jgi:membrane fusion protein, multidrug efflux system
VSLSVPERYYSGIRIGQDVTLTAEAVPGETFRAQITAINPVVDVNGRALQLLATLDNKDLQLRPGMLVKADILGPERQAVTIPESAVVPQGQSSTVFAVIENKAKRRDITTGTRREGWVEVVSGLSAGDSVVTAGNARLADGAAVKVTPATATPPPKTTQ